MKVEIKITDDDGNVLNNIVSNSLHLIDFIEEIEYMQALYSNGKYTQAEVIKNKLAEQLEDLMKLGNNNH